MDREWSDSQPIYRQLREVMVEMILGGIVKEGDALPSARSVAAEFRVNPLTVLKSYQALVDEGVAETRRGLGMFVMKGARKALLKAERERFFGEEWPRIRTIIDRLGLTLEEVLDREMTQEPSDGGQPIADKPIPPEEKD